MGLMISKSLIEVGADLEGMTDGMRGDSGLPDEPLGQNIERRRVRIGAPSRGTIEGEIGGVMVTRGSNATTDLGRTVETGGSACISNAFPTDLSAILSATPSAGVSSSLLSVAFSDDLAPAFSDMGSGSCDATIGSASARGEEIEDGVEERVNRLNP